MIDAVGILCYARIQHDVDIAMQVWPCDLDWLDASNGQFDVTSRDQWGMFLQHSHVLLQGPSAI